MAGLAAGARYVIRRRGPAAALGATGGFSFLFGPLFLMVDPAVPGLFLPVECRCGRGPSGRAGDRVRGRLLLRRADYPVGDRRLSKPPWITLLLAASAVVTIALGETFNQLAYLALGFCLYLTRQGVAICATTILQEEVDDAYRGRMFAFYDMMFNVTYAVGAGLPPRSCRTTATLRLSSPS